MLFSFVIDRYLKAPFDSEKVYQTISEIVDKIFLPTIEEEEDAPPRPYVCINNFFKRKQAFNELKSTGIQCKRERQLMPKIIEGDSRCIEIMEKSSKISNHSTSLYCRKKSPRSSYVNISIKL